PPRGPDGRERRNGARTGDRGRALAPASRDGFNGAGHSALFDCIERGQLRFRKLRALPGPHFGRCDFLELYVARLARDDVDLAGRGGAAFLPAKYLDPGFDLRAALAEPFPDSA